VGATSWHGEPVELAPGAEENGFANMLHAMLSQNFEAKPHKLSDLRKMQGTAALVADDAGVAVTLRFMRGVVVIESGVRGVPDVCVRGTTDAVMSMSNMPITFGLPLPNPRDKEAKAAYDGINLAMKKGEIHVHGMLRHFFFMQRFTRIMSVNG
jgi:hypothetical protein